MYRIQYVQDDCFKTIEVISKDIANREYKELCNDPSVSELEATILTVDVRFSSSNKVYTYLIDAPLFGYRFVKLPSDDLLQIVEVRYRTPKLLKAMARSRGFSYDQYKVLHGTAIK